MVGSIELFGIGLRGGSAQRDRRQLMLFPGPKDLDVLEIGLVTPHRDDQDHGTLRL